MEIGILTYYGVHNHGAVLQAYGLKRVLEKKGHHVLTLTFERNYDYIPVELKRKYEISFRSIHFFCKYMAEKGISNVLYNYRKRCVLKSFRTSSFDMSVKFNLFYGDAVIIGSDEVFSLEIGYNSMLFGYGIQAERVLSYAGSFGPTTIDDIRIKGKEKQISDGLKKFTAISVRDCNSKKIIEELCGTDIPIVCDPVILYGFSQEMNYFTPQEKGYIAIYAYDNRMNDPAEVCKIKKFAKTHGFRIYSIGYYHKWCDKNINVSPFELLGWIKNAKIVITDTFHGSVLSIICNTSMIVKLRGNINKLVYLLGEYSLIDRITESFDDLEDIFNNKPDFQKVNQILTEKREKSINFLNNVLNTEQ